MDSTLLGGARFNGHGIRQRYSNRIYCWEARTDISIKGQSLMGQQSALVLGASGLIGSEVLSLCLGSDHYDRVIAPVRRPLNIIHEKLSEMVIDFDMPPWETLFPVDHVFAV